MRQNECEIYFLKRLFSCKNDFNLKIFIIIISPLNYMCVLFLKVLYKNSR